MKQKQMLIPYFRTLKFSLKWYPKSMSVCLFVRCVYVCVCVCVTICGCGYVSVPLSVCVCLCVFLSVCVCLWLCVYVSVSLCVCVCVCLCLCVSVCVGTRGVGHQTTRCLLPRGPTSTSRKNHPQSQKNWLKKMLLNKQQIVFLDYHFKRTTFLAPLHNQAQI